jgi:ParB-like chromosome segregation protein Spo0J
MRADPHYVEQLTTANAPMPLRFVPLTAIDEPESVELPDIAPLTRSIRTFGVLHPLLLVTEHGRYQVIAGRKRFYAARAAGLSAVPCFVHHVPRAEAEALAQADNLRCAEPAPPSEASPAAERPTDLSRHLSRHLTGIASAQRLLVEAGGEIAEGAALDLIHVHTARASWLIKAADFLAAPQAEGERPRQTVGTLIEELAAEFAPEARLARVPLRVRVDDRAYTTRLDKQAFSLGLTGAIVALLPFADADANSVLTLTALKSVDALTIDLGQMPTRMDPALGRSFFDPGWTTRPGGWPASLGALVLKTAVERQNGTVECESDASRVRLRITIPVQH